MSLTESQARVATLADGGLTNREIAERLFVTIKTVETHLMAVYRKLGIKSRDELRSALGQCPADRHGLDVPVTRVDPGRTGGPDSGESTHREAPDSVRPGVEGERSMAESRRATILATRSSTTSPSRCRGTSATTRPALQAYLDTIAE